MPRLNKHEVFMQAKAILCDMEVASSVLDRVNGMRKLFTFFLKRECGLYLFTNSRFLETCRKKCYYMLDAVPKTFSFVSPLVHKYYYDDEELRARVNKARNHCRRQKQKQKQMQKQKINEATRSDAEHHLVPSGKAVEEWANALPDNEKTKLRSIVSRGTMQGSQGTTLVLVLRVEAEKFVTEFTHCS